MKQPLPFAFTRRASKQVEEAGRWWRENRAKALEALREELDQALQLIASQPEVGAMARNATLTGVRRILLSRVSYNCTTALGHPCSIDSSRSLVARKQRPRSTRVNTPPNPSG